MLGAARPWPSPEPQRRLKSQFIAGDREEIVDVQSKSIVAEEPLAGRYEAGLTHLEHLPKRPEELRLELEIGEIDTTWVVYGTRKRFQGDVIGIPSPEVFGVAQSVGT